MKSILSASVAILTAFLLFIACNKIDTTDLGSGLIPPIDNVHTFDTTFAVISDNLLSNDDSVNMLYTELHGAGIIENDAEFGKTAAHFYTSFAPSQSRSYPFVKRDTVRIDSVVLSLAYGGIYGDSTSIEQIEVRELDPLFNFEDTGYAITHPDFPVQTGVIGTKTVAFRTLNDTLQYKNAKDTISTANELRIHLDTGWARRFVLYDTTAGDAYNNDSLFLGKLRGLEVRAAESSPEKRAVAYFRLTDNARTRITFYCRIQNNGRTDTIAPYFIYKNRYPEANMVRRTPAGNYLANVVNATQNDQLVYIQATPGSYAAVQIPGLNGIPNCVIHRAELIMEKSPSLDESLYPPPPRLFIQGLAGDTTITVRNDFIPANSAAGYDLASLGGIFAKNQYVFNLTRYVQSILTKGYRNYTLKISSPFTVAPLFVTSADVISSQPIPLVVNPLLAGGRVVLYGGAHTDTTKAMRLRIIYSKI